MHCLDYISDKPKFYIFKKETNKTNLGGLLFLLYIIIMLLISSAYIADYIINDKYTYDALSFYNYTTKEDEILLNEDNILNPYFNISLGLFDNEHLVVYDNNYNKFLKSDEIDEYDGSYVYNIKRRVNDTYLCIFYICEDKNCSSYNDLIEQTNNFGWIEVYYPNYQINHYDKIPVQKYEDESTIFSEDLEIPNTVGYQSWTFKWEVIKYKDQKSLFDSITKQQREYTFGHIKNEEPKKELKSIYTNTGYFMPFFEIISTNKHKEYLSYTRKKVDILDVLANIGALFSTIKYFFTLFFYYYEKNFDNYKIIESILNKPKEKFKEIELSSDFNISSKIKNRENKDKKINTISNFEPLINNREIENKYSINNYSDNNSDINKEYDETFDDSSSFNLKKLHFYHFFFNNLYCKCCKKIRNQEIIEHINDIIYKYLSIDSLLYNQIKLENLFQDYNWNYSSSEQIQKNKMIIKLEKVCKMKYN